ncbi:hypothetical protein DFS33DRAFT_225944 [Desarmillaria ectypa]|nr:hypothetical protein DFS33DRAFT_225944 [Desarmillaria ectypa]
MSGDMNADTEVSNVSSLREAQASQDVVPINRLPLELLQSIFGFTTLSPADPTAPWRLSLVCKFWRAIVTSFPLLWTNIVIDNGSPNPDGFIDMGARSAFPVLMSYLRFSSPLPVNISVSVRGMPRAHSPLTRAHAGVLSHIFRRLSRRIRSMNFTFDSWEFYGLLTEGLTHVQMPVLVQWRARYINDPLVIYNEGFRAKNLDCRFESTILTAGASRPHELVSRGIALYPNLRYLYLVSTPMPWDMFCPSNLIELHIYDLPPQYRPDAIQLRQILELSRDTLQALELSGIIFQDSALGDPLTMPRVHTLKLGFSLAEELGGLFPELQFPALRSLEVNNLDRKSTWFGCSPEDMQLAVTPAFEALAMFLPLHQLKHLRLDCITFHLPSNHLPTSGSGQDPVSLTFFKNLTSLTSLSLYSPDVVTFGCMNYSPDILPALKALKISTPGVNYYEHILSFWQERAHMPTCKMLEHFELTLPMCAKGRAEAFIQRNEVFAKRVVLDYQPDMHPLAWMLQDVEMGEDGADEMDREEIDESEDSSGEMDED